MAQAAAVDYAATYSNGNLAAAVGGAARAERYARPGALPAAPERARQGAREREPAREEKAYGVSLFAVVGAVLVAALMTLVVLAYVSMTTVSKSTVDLKLRINELEAEERRLRIDYENVFDMAQIESYAVNVLGMLPASEGQIGAISAAATDKAVIIGDDAAGKGNFIDDMTGFIASLLEYFR